MSSIYPPNGSTPAQLCQRCGKPLPPNETYCANCGLLNSPAQPNLAGAQSPSGMSWGGPGSTSAPQVPFGSGQFAKQQWGQSPAQPSSNGPFNGSSVPQLPFNQPDQQPFQQPANPNNYYGAPGQQPGPNNSFGVQQPFYPQQPQQPMPGNMGGYPPGGFGQTPASNGYQQAAFQQGSFTQIPPMNGLQQGSFAQSPAMNSYQPENFSQPPEGKRKPRIGLMIAIIVILLVVVGGSIGGYAYIKRNSGTVTAQVTPTMVPTPIPKGTPLFTDALVSNNAGWDLTSKAGQFSIKIGGGFMVLEDDNNKLFFELLPGNKNFNDFFLTTDAVLSQGTQGNGYGIYIRGASNQNADIATYYRFELYGDGTYAIFKGTVDSTGTSQSTLLVNYTPSPAILKQGQVNHIAISAKGPTMTFIVNGQTLKIVTDNTYTSGSIALFVSNLPHTKAGAQATFSKRAIYPPQS
ncbi:MAG: hypothetical protein NVSMB27_25850 [Ktedonobacteraceae bacterium]